MEEGWGCRQRPDHKVPYKAASEFGMSPNGSRKDGMWRKAGKVACVERGRTEDCLRYARYRPYVKQLREKAGWTGKDIWGPAYLSMCPKLVSLKWFPSLDPLLGIVGKLVQNYGQPCPQQVSTKRSQTTFGKSLQIREEFAITQTPPGAFSCSSR